MSTSTSHDRLVPGPGAASVAGDRADSRSGRDATEAFEDVGHSDEARAMLPKMLLGEFKGEVSVGSSSHIAPTRA